jgi:trimeric autotransporter adhesin
VHAAVQSSELMNMYTGNVVLDDVGGAVIQLPTWFQAENADFRYSLAAVGAPAPNLYVAEEVAGNQFKIAGGRAGQKISWTVTAIAQDAYAKANPLVAEEQKNTRERGFFMHPEVYGQPEEKGIQWALRPRMMKRIKATREKQLASAKASGTAEAPLTPRVN